DWTGRDYKRWLKMVCYDKLKYATGDSLGLCSFMSGYWPFPPILPAHEARLASYATGIDLDESELMKIGERITILLRAYNTILGIRRKDDILDENWFREPALPQEVQIDRSLFEEWLDEYNKLEGCNSDGIPTGEKLDELGLNHVRQELERRGILP
ncbi:aldehyde ferredoxin oxidoreductase C-terminal domain-containing protein, partial [Chloroflexota bacterium]